MELMSCPSLAVPNDVMQHVVHVESAYNPYAIGVVGGRLARQPRNLAEALATARMLEGRGYNFSIGLAQVNRHNLAHYGLDSYERAFEACPNLQAGSRILAECYGRSGGDWGKSFSCYYSGNFTTGFQHGYVQKVFASMRDAERTVDSVAAIEVIDRPARKAVVSPRAANARSLRRPIAVSASPWSRVGSPSESESGDKAQMTALRSDVTPSSDALRAAEASEPASLPGDQAFVF